MKRTTKKNDPNAGGGGKLYLERPAEERNLQKTRPNQTRHLTKSDTFCRGKVEPKK